MKNSVRSLEEPLRVRWCVCACGWASVEGPVLGLVLGGGGGVLLPGRVVERTEEEFANGRVARVGMALLD